ncbi:hypothetical protein ABKV19_020115 [Rosa sericea]
MRTGTLYPKFRAFLESACSSTYFAGIAFCASLPNTWNNKLIVASQKVQVQAGISTASAGRNFDSKSHFIAGIWWTRLLGVLPREHQGRLL